MALGGAVGGLARVALGERGAGDGLPWDTLVANLVGAALLAWVVVRLADARGSAAWTRALLGTGLCGALTTFAALPLELATLAENAHPGAVVLYLLVLVVGGLATVVVVTRLATRAAARRAVATGGRVG